MTVPSAFRRVKSAVCHPEAGVSVLQERASMAVRV